MKEGVPHLAITREEDNPIFLHIDEAFTQLSTTGNYRPSAEDVAAALASESTIDIDLTKLGLQGYGIEWGYLTIYTNRGGILNEEERKLAERVHGSGPAFAATMKMYADAGFNETTVYVLKPGYVKKHAKKGAIGRASRLSGIYGDSYFSANNRVVNHNDVLHGVRRPTI